MRRMPRPKTSWDWPGPTAAPEFDGLRVQPARALEAISFSTEAVPSPAAFFNRGPHLRLFLGRPLAPGSEPSAGTDPSSRESSSAAGFRILLTLSPKCRFPSLSGGLRTEAFDFNLLDWRCTGITTAMDGSRLGLVASSIRPLPCEGAQAEVLCRRSGCDARCLWTAVTSPLCLLVTLLPSNLFDLASRFTLSAASAPWLCGGNGEVCIPAELSVRRAPSESVDDSESLG